MGYFGFILSALEKSSWRYNLKLLLQAFPMRKCLLETSMCLEWILNLETYDTYKDKLFVPCVIR